MTHDELLERVQYNQGYQMGLDGYKICSALRAVVELHKPYEPTKIGTVCKACGITSDYPCPTIQVIEKEF